jgi:hypothetical protein
MLHLRMVRTKARDSYSAKLCPLTEFRSCSLAFRRRIRCVRKSCTIENPLWVNLFLQTVRPSLPAFTDKQTFSEPVGTSHLCQQETHASQFAEVRRIGHQAT